MHARHASARIVAIVLVCARARRRRTSTRTSSRPRRRSTPRRSRTSCSSVHPVRARLRAGPDVVRLRDHRADRQLPRRVRARAAARASSSRRRGSSRCSGSSRSPGSSAAGAPAVTALLMLARDRRHGRLGAGDGHRLAGARRDRDRRRRSASRSASGRRRARAWRGCCGRCSTRCRRCPQLVYIIPFIYLMPVSRVPGRRRLRALRRAGRDPARHVGRARRAAGRGGGRDRRSARRAGRCSRR